jgi:hypothetical protein
MEQPTYMIKFKYGDLEFKISGDKDFVENHFEEFKEMLNNNTLFNSLGNIKSNVNKSIIKDLKSENFEDIEIPLDVYLNKYDTVGLQQKFLATALYLIEVKKQNSFRSRAINKLLKENNLEPFQAAATHIQRLRDKGLMSIIGKEGNESIITIYKDHIENAKDYLKEKE